MKKKESSKKKKKSIKYEDVSLDELDNDCFIKGR
jgi:hypothetical protein